MAEKQAWMSHPRPPATIHHRLTKVLSSKKTTFRATKANQEISEQTNVTSRLMRLPPEIRNRIWRYTLSGQLVHITSRTNDGRRVRHATCTKFSETNLAGLPKITNDIALAYDRSHQICVSSMGIQRLSSRQDPSSSDRDPFFYRRLNLSLLQTCRQIHAEASLPPYSENTFCISGKGDFLVLERFLHGLALEQARAITSIVMICQANEDLTIHASTKRCLKNNFTGLEILGLVFEFTLPTFFNSRFERLWMQKHSSAVAALRDSVGKFTRVRARNTRWGDMVMYLGAKPIPKKAPREWEADMMEVLAPKEDGEGGQDVTGDEKAG